MVILALAILGPDLLALLNLDPLAQDLSNTFGTPTPAHLFGTDEVGRDVLLRLIYGARMSILVAALTVGLALVAGVSAGLVSALLGGWVDEVLMRLVDLVLAIPSILFFILVATLLRPDAIGIGIMIAVVGWGPMARVVRAEALSLMHREFITASRSIGAPNLRLLVRHLLPNVVHVIVVGASLLFGQVMLTEAALDYLGLGIQPPTVTWGNMLAFSASYYDAGPHLIVFPGTVIFLAVLTTSLFGNAVRDALDPRLVRR